ncbi:hypothetical protein EI555_009652, partial [Monodon monoceros]
MAVILLNIKDDMLEKNAVAVINARRLLASAPCLLSIGEFILWIKPMNVMGIENLLASSQTLLGTKELIMKLKPMSFITLRLDERIHVGGKPYKCNDCRMSLRQSSNIEQHFRIL